MIGISIVDLIAGGKGRKKEETAAISWFQAPKKRKRLTDWEWHPISNVGWVMSIMYATGYGQ